MPVMIAIRWWAAGLLALVGVALITVGGLVGVLHQRLRQDSFAGWQSVVCMVALFGALAGGGVGWLCGRVAPLESSRSKAWWIVGAVLGLILGGFGAFAFYCLAAAFH